MSIPCCPQCGKFPATSNPVCPQCYADIPFEYQEFQDAAWVVRACPQCETVLVIEEFVTYRARPATNDDLAQVYR